MSAAAPEAHGGSRMKGGRRHMECPSCGGTRLFRSRRRGFMDHFASTVWGAKPYRCRDCFLRFYAPALKKPGRAGLVALGVVVLLAAGAAGWYLWSPGGTAPAQRTAPVVTQSLPGEPQPVRQGRQDALDSETRQMLEALRSAGGPGSSKKP